MSLNYKKNKGNEDHGTFWTSYSDLFLGMSVVFLLLYVTASLRTGTNGIQQQIQNQRLSMEVQDLKNQLKMYDSVKNEYLQSQASPAEDQQYKELMDKLTLLKDEAKDEKERLQNEALQNGKKEEALNQYQQLVRNMINANMMSKTKIKTRENVIGKQDVEIKDQDQQITGLKSDIDQKKNLIAANEKKIADADAQLKNRLHELKQAYHKKKMSEAAYEKKMGQLKAESASKLTQLKNVNKTYESQLQQSTQEMKQIQSQLAQTNTQLDQTRGALAQTSGQLNETKGALAQTTGALTQTKGALDQTQGELSQAKGSLAAKEGENQQLKGKLSQAEMDYNSKVAGMKKGFADQQAKDRAAFEAGLAKERLGSAEIARREGAFRAQSEAKERALGGQIAALGGQLKDTEGQLAKAKAEADTRRKIASDIREGFKKAGVKADIDDQTGEVLINFGNVYFDNDSAKLKAQMKDVLKKAMPIYSQSLLGNEKVARKVSAIEIIGFASPTFNGKYVDPKNLSGGSKKAVDYNLDLSYKRARSIFQYVFDEQKMQFAHQKDMLPLIKVTGRSFLAEKLPGSRNPASGDFCATHDCKTAQKVIIKFSFEDRK